MCTCDEALELISGGLDGALTETETQKLNEHLTSCDACRALAQELKTIHIRLPELVEEPPVGFREAVMARIAAEPVMLRPKKGKAKSGWRTWVPMAAVFAVILVGAGALSSLNGGSSGVVPMPMTAGVGGAEALPAAAPPSAQDGTVPPSPQNATAGAGTDAGVEAQEKGHSAYDLNGAAGSAGGAQPQADQPAPGTGGGAETAQSTAPQPSTAPPPSAAPPSTLMTARNGAVGLTPRQALEVLIAYDYGGEDLPEGGELVDAEGVLGYCLADGVCADYQGPSKNQKYYIFQRYTQLEGENGQVRQDGNSVAVSLDGLTILEESTGVGQEDEAFRAATED